MLHIIDIAAEEAAPDLAGTGNAPAGEPAEGGPVAARVPLGPGAVATLKGALRSALHLTVVIHLPGGKSQAYDAATGSVKTFRVAQGGTNWDHVVKFGIGVMLAFIAALFFLAATVGARRSRRRIV